MVLWVWDNSAGRCQHLTSAAGKKISPEKLGYFDKRLAVGWGGADSRLLGLEEWNYSFWGKTCVRFQWRNQIQAN